MILRVSPRVSPRASIHRSVSALTATPLMVTLLLVAAGTANGQGVCTANNQASCTAGGDATHSITLTISTNARLTSPSSNVTLSTPNSADFAAGFGTAISVPLSILSNSSWMVSLRAGAPTWTASPGSAWQTKPAGDLQWGLTSGGTFTDFTTSPVSVQTGTATGTAVLNVWLRTRFLWTADTPGSYSLPIEVIVTAP